MKRGNQVAALIAAALAAIAPALPAAAQVATAEPSPSATATQAVVNPLDIEVIGLRNDSGEVGCSLFNAPEGFPRDDTRVMRHVWAPIHDGKATCEFVGLAPGRYAAVVFHDENGDHEFNMNAFGMPKEGYGFSRDAAALFGPPSFESAAFDYGGKTSLYIVVNIRY
jgi:uncharacterized protein (DUF2141 family)